MSETDTINTAESRDIEPDSEDQDAPDIDAELGSVPDEKAVAFGRPGRIPLSPKENAAVDEAIRNGRYVRVDQGYSQCPDRLRRPRGSWGYHWV